MGASQIITVWTSHQLRSNAGFASSVTSCPVNVGAGNTVVLSATVINADAGATGTFELQGSVDGMTWQSIANFNQNAYGFNSVAAPQIVTPLLRVAAIVAGTDVSMLFTVHLAVSEQGQ